MIMIKVSRRYIQIVYRSDELCLTMSSPHLLHMVPFDIADNKNIQQDHVAIIFDDHEQKNVITYNQLFIMSAEIEMKIQSLCRTCEVIGICIPDSPHVIPVILGVLSGRCIFYNFEPQGQGSVGHVLNNVGVRMLIVSRKYLRALNKLLSDYDGEYIEASSTLSADIVFIRLQRVPAKSHDQGLAYCITTSGTTGVPKVVMVTHNCIVPNIQHLQKIYSTTERDVIFMSSPLTFDPSIVEIFVTLTSKACLLMTSHRVKQSPTKLLDILTRHKVSVIQATPSLIGRMSPQKLSSSILSADSSLRVLALGGEDFPALPVIRSWRAGQNTTTFINLYGVTEVSCWAMYHVLSSEDLSKDDGKVPLGQPLQDTEIRVRDQHGYPVLTGIGELYIGGSKRSCFVDAADRKGTGIDKLYPTGDVVEMTENGHMLYRGRKDSQVKRNGMRINLQQIDHVLLESGLVLWGKAMYHNNKLFLFYSTDKEHEIEAAYDLHHSVEALIRDTLPSHYWPDVVKMLKVIPITSHGKTDVSVLKRMIDEDDRVYKLNDENPVIEIRRILMKLLQIDEINVKMNFLEVGGNSMLAVQFLSEIECLLNQQIPDLLEIILDKSVKDVTDFVENLLITPTEFKDHKNKREDECLKTSDRVGVNLSEHQGNTVRSSPSETHVSIKKRKLDDHASSQTCMTDSCKRPHEVYHSRKSYGLYSIRRGNQFQMIDEKCNSNKMDKSSLRDCWRCKIMVDNIQEESTVNKYICNIQLKELWRYDTVKCVDASPLVVYLSDGHSAVFIGSHSHKFCSISMETGNKLWETTLGDRVESSACLSACGQYVIVGCYDGALYFLCINTGEIYWKFQTEGEVKCSPNVDTLTNLVIFGSHDKHLYALDTQSQLCHWRKELGGGSVFSSPCIVTNPHVIIACTLTGWIVCLNPTNGEILWQYNTEKPVFSSPVYTPAGPCVGCVDGNVYQLSHTGKLIWKYTTSSPIFSSPTLIWLHEEFTGVQRKSGMSPVKSGIKSQSAMYSSQQVLVEDCYRTISSCDYRIIIGSHDCHVYCLCSNGSLQWKLQLNSFVYSSPFGFTPTFESDQHTSSNISSKNFKQSSKSDSITGHAKDLSVTHNKDEKDCSKTLLCTSCIRICDMCVVASSTGSLYLINTKSGDLVTSHALLGKVFSSPVVYKDHIIVGCRDNFIYCFKYEKLKDL